MIVWSFSISEHVTVSDYTDMTNRLVTRGSAKKWGEYVTVVRGICQRREDSMLQY